MVFATGVQALGSRSARRKPQRPRKPRARRSRSPTAFNGIPETPSAFKLVWQTPEMCQGRFVLEDLRRVLLFETTAVVLEPSEQQREHDCLACAVTHQSGNWDCADQRIVPAAVCRAIDDEVAHSPLTGEAVGVIRLGGLGAATRFRRLGHHSYTFKPIAAAHNPRCT